MNLIHSFDPIVDDNSRILILGTMPGPESLKQQEYYAYSRNKFWKIMGELTGAYGDYDIRKQKLKSAEIAVWDVLHSCTRSGASDSAIRNPVPNDFKSFFSKYQNIKHIFFNGQPPEKFFHRYFPDMKNKTGLQFHTLPSTSPARAMPQGAKLEAWRAILKV